MTKRNRVKNFIQGFVTVLFALALILFPAGALPIVIAIIGFGMTLKGLRALVYYFTMARSMVGGKSTLYRGILFLDLGIFTSSLADGQRFIVVIYIAAMNLFTGAIAILKARESKKARVPQWKWGFAFGVAAIVMSVVSLITGVILRDPDVTIIVYAAGLLYSGVIMIASAFKRTAIVYIP